MQRDSMKGAQLNRQSYQSPIGLSIDKIIANSGTRSAGRGRQAKGSLTAGQLWLWRRRQLAARNLKFESESIDIGF